MKIAYFTHSLSSCWNHGNAHFVRGVLDELTQRGHHVRAYEPQGAWSRTNLIADHGRAGLAAFAEAYPRLHPRIYADNADPEPLVENADLVIVHEWNPPDLVAQIGALRKGGARFRLLFHDTHHRAVSAPDDMRAYDLSGYDGVLAFGEALAQVYRGWGWGHRVHVWHEAADVRRFHPPAQETQRRGLVWIGNWGDGERSEELTEFLLRPAQAAGLPLDIYGVRYPLAAMVTLARYGVRYRGWTANPRAPDIFAKAIATVHVPRRFYAQQLPGIPTIRVFEALACGIPLVCAPWDDAEGLFRPGTDYLTARNEAEMTACLTDLAADPAMRAELAANGLETIRKRHTCAHRVDELLALAAIPQGTSAQGTLAQHRQEPA